MDDKLFIFIFLIPGLVLGGDYLLLRKAQNGMKIFKVIATVVVSFISILLLIPQVLPNLIPDLGSFIGLFIFWYLILVVGLIISIVIATGRKPEDDQT